jgi:hypothetical protein
MLILFKQPPSVVLTASDGCESFTIKETRKVDSMEIAIETSMSKESMHKSLQLYLPPTSIGQYP